MKTISLCMIVKNEEDVLARALESICGVVDEIIIVDTGSTDNTKAIALKYTNRVYDYAWDDNFSNARNYAFSLATCDYIMWLDADDYVPKSTATAINLLKRNLKSDVYMLKYDLILNGNTSVFSFYRERILRRCSASIWQGAVHECIIPFGKIEKLNLSIEHKKENFKDPNRNYKIYKKLLKTKNLNARELYYYARELFDHKKYKECITILNKFLKRDDAWKENKIDALFILSICYELTNNRKKQLSCILQSFSLDSPRANFCCKLGDYFLKENEVTSAIYWYKTATKCKDVIKSGGFVFKDYYNYYPHLQLCCAYYKLGNIKMAIKHNNLAKKYKITNITTQNDYFFENLNKKHPL